MLRYRACDFGGVFSSWVQCGADIATTTESKGAMVVPSRGICFPRPGCILFISCITCTLFIFAYCLYLYGFCMRASRQYQYCRTVDVSLRGACLCTWCARIPRPKLLIMRNDREYGSPTLTAGPAHAGLFYPTPRVVVPGG
jgi:hypothetical protein